MNVRTCILIFLLPLAFCTPGAGQQHPSLRSGPMVGYGEMTEVMLWVQAAEPLEVQYRYWKEGSTTKHLSASQPARREKDFIVHTLITGLEPGTRFQYELLLNGKVADRPYPLRFQTQPLWQWRTDPPDFTVAFGSCVYVNDSLADRPGSAYGGGYEIFEAITEMQPDLMLWIGDNVYYREVDWTSVTGMRRRNEHTRALPSMQPLLGASHNYAIWDDHDYGPDDSDRTFRLRKESLDLFKLYWANHTYGIDEAPGVFGRFEWGDVEFFLLDNRYHRSPNHTRGEDKTMLGHHQLRWLQESLLSSRATFKVVVGGNQMLATTIFESFSRYQREQTELLDWIRMHDIGGVLFLSGDRHHAVLSCLTDSNFYPLYDFTSSPLTAGLYHPRPDDRNVLAVPGTAVFDARSFGLIKFSGPRRHRILQMECYDTQGTLRWSHQVQASEIRRQGQ